MPESVQEVEEDWYERSFSALYPILYAHRTVEAALPEVEFASRVLRILPHEHVLDMACGSGRHMLHLQRFADRVVGVDFSHTLLGHARETLGPNGCLVRGDMRAIPFENAFDAVCSFFTSFGYFQTDEEDRATLGGVQRALRKGGRFLLDYFNSDYAQSTLIPCSTRSFDGYEIDEQRWLDTTTKRLNKRIHITDVTGREHTFLESVRVFSTADMNRLFTESGLNIEAWYGDYSGGPISPSSPRMIIVARKGDA